MKILILLLISPLVLSLDVYRFNSPTGKTSVKRQFCDRANKYSCTNLETCCPTGLPSPNEFSCCGLIDANCCDKGKKCCPKSYICSSSTKHCYPTLLSNLFGESKKSVSISTKPARHESLEKPVFEVNHKTVTCPDQNTDCDDGQTCCQLKDGRYSCCPTSNGVCCSDYLHCCPQGTTCDVSVGKCISNTGIIIIKHFLKLMKKDKVSKYQSVLCPDSKTYCNDGQTCCQMLDGSYGCCPYPNAVCCSDHVHCCPHGTTCDASQGTCLNSAGDVIQNMMKKKVAKKMNSDQSVMCQDNKSQCPDGQTCCKLSDGSYGCCPSPNAVCCSDHIHCCPHGTTCDVSSGRCFNSAGDVIQNMIKKKVAKKIDTLTTVVCPDGTHQCPDGHTCCQLSDGSYGCCPSPNAVCCSDHVHCCPQGTKCDLSSGRCLNNAGDVIQNMMIKKYVNKFVVCPDGKSQCPDIFTCCQISDGSYGCCPTQYAVCCSDHKSCCPHGSTCDVPNRKCLNSAGNFVQNMMEKEFARKINFVDSVNCPDHKSQCDNGQTCCQMSDGSFGCCPSPNAVCCSDYVHCCPHGTTCDVPHGKCVNGNGKVIQNMMKKKGLKVN